MAICSRTTQTGHHATLICCWLAAAVLTATFAPWQGIATAAASDDDQLIESLVSRNKPPKHDVDGEARFPQDYDYQSQTTVLDAWEQLNASADRAWPSILKHTDDKRYSVTLEDRFGYDEDLTVGDVCKQIVEMHLNVWQHYADRDVDPKEREHDHAVGGPREYRVAHFDWEAEVKKAVAGAPPSLYALQVKSFEWALQGQRTKWPLRNDAKQRVVVECLQKRLDELVKSGQPIPCRLWSIEWFTIHHDPKGPRIDYGQPNGKRVEKAKAEVAKLASRNQPPPIAADGSVMFPANYDSAAQQQTVAAIRSLTATFDQAETDAALVSAIRDKSYCLTLERPGEKPRNVSVGQLCCELITENVNIHKPYVRPVADGYLYPMFVLPVPQSIAQWWAEFKNNSMDQVWHEAFAWAKKYEEMRHGFASAHDESVAVRLLESHQNEMWSSAFPRPIDVLKGQRGASQIERHTGACNAARQRRQTLTHWSSTSGTLSRRGVIDATSSPVFISVD